MGKGKGEGEGKAKGQGKGSGKARAERRRSTEHPEQFNSANGHRPCSSRSSDAEMQVLWHRSSCSKAQEGTQCMQRPPPAMLPSIQTVERGEQAIALQFEPLCCRC